MKIYRKIDIYVDGDYVASTMQRKSLKEAVTKFIAYPVVATVGGTKRIAPGKIEAVYAASKSRRNPSTKLPSGIAPDGTRYTVKKDRVWNEWQVRAYVNGKWNEDRTYFGGSGNEPGAKEDAINTWHQLMTFKRNPRLDPWYGGKIPRGTGVSYLDERTGHSVHTVVVLNRGQRYKCEGANGEITFHDRQDLLVGKESSP